MNHYKAQKIDDKYFVFQNRGGAVAMVINNPDQVIGDLKKISALGARMYDAFAKKDNDNFTFVSDKCEKMTSDEWENAASSFMSTYYECEWDRIQHASDVSTLSTLIYKNLEAASNLSKAYDALVKNNTPENMEAYKDCEHLYKDRYSNKNLNMWLQKITGENWNVNSALTDHRRMLEEIETITDNIPFDMSFGYDLVVTDIKNIGEKYGVMARTQKKTLSEVKKEVAEKKVSADHTDGKTKSNGR